MIEEIYLIKRDGMTKSGKDTPWLLNIRPGGFKEFMEDGTLAEVNTCLWGNRQQDAKVYTDFQEARVIARTIGGCIVVPARREKRDGLERTDG
jgi:hypothetical protein